MGKDKKPITAPAVTNGGKNAPPPVADTKAGGRGHRQRGAGTVITAKPAVVTDDGIVLKAHERLPAQILHEYCQREKRPTPRYFREPPGLRFKVILEDPKNSRHDMQFCPVQSFESETMARHYAALLALFHVQKSIPLERKLPEPFSTTWLQMIRNNSAEDTVTTAAPAKESATATLPVTSSTASTSTVNSTTQIAQTTTSSSGPAAPQWLCDSCATPNFVMNANGTVRIKCFRCQTPKPEVVSMTSAPSKLHSNTQYTQKGSNVSTNSTSKSEKKPQVVLDLQAKGSYISQAEREAEQMNRKLRQTSNMTYLEALKNANPLNRIQIPLEMRERLEKLLDIVHQQEANSLSEPMKSELNQSQSQKQKNNYSQESVELISSLSSEDYSLYFSGWTASSLLAVKQSTWWIEQALPTMTNTEVSWWLHSLLLSIGSDRIFQKISENSSCSPSDFLTLFAHRLQQSKISTLNSGEMTEKRSVLNEEQEAISAILGDNLDTPVEFRHSVTGDVDVVVQNIALPDVWKTMLKLKKTCCLTAMIHIPVNCAYPSESPVVMVTITGYPEGKSLPAFIQDGLKQVNIYVNEKLVSDWQGTLVVFEIFSLLQHLALDEVVAAVPMDAEKLQNKLNSVLNLTSTDSEKDVVDLSLETLSIAEESIPSSDVSTIGDVSRKQSKTAHTKPSSHKHTQPKAHPFWRRTLSNAHMTKDTSPFQEDKIPVERRNLPAWQQRNAFLSAIADQDCVIVTGETGCGKTTQIPQFLHETYPQAKILICQPRRLAATGVAQRVAEEVDMMLSPATHGHATQSKGKHHPTPALHQMNPVGYMVKGDSHISTHTKIAFVTYGVLLRRLQDDPSLDSIDYVILDEVHERGMDSDFCLALLIEAIQRRRQSLHIPPLKLILMSATISTATFRDYLLKQLYGSMPSQEEVLSSLCPIIDIPGRTYPVTEFFKQEFETFVKTLSLNKPVANSQKRTIRDTEKDISGSDYSSEDDDDLVLLDNPATGPHSQDMYVPERREISLNNPHRTKDIDYDLLIRLVFNLILGRAPPSEETNSSELNDNEKWQKAEGCILIFLPGVPEITKVLHHLRTHWPTILASPYLSNHKPPRLEMLPLHGNLSPQEQRQVFVTYPKTHNVIKIVAATNVAEASVTIPDVTVVIDTCRVKEMSFDSTSTQAWQLTMQFAAKDALRQRKGRAGRVQQGRCYRLITRNTYENRLSAISTPEILRLPLDNVLLQTFAMVQAQQTDTTMAKTDQYTRCLELLQKCPSPPATVAITRAKDALLSLQALEYSKLSSSKKQSTIEVKEGYVLSPLGVLLAKLPMLPRLGKLLIYGRLLQCTLPAVCIAAALSSGSGNKPIFVSSPAGTGGDLAALQATVQAVKERILRENSAVHRELLASNNNTSANSSGMYSDYYIIAQLTMKYLTCHQQHGNNPSTSVTAARRHFCKQHCLHFERMQEIAQSVSDLIEDVRDLGLLHAGLEPTPKHVSYDVHPSHALSRHDKHVHSLQHVTKGSLFAQIIDVQHPFFNKYAQQPRLLAAVFVAGLYPQVMQIQRPPKKFMEVMGAAVEKDVLAKEIAFYVPTLQNEEVDDNNNVSNNNSSGKSNDDVDDTEDRTPYMSPHSTSSSSSSFIFQSKREQDIYFSACIVRRPDVTLQRVQRVFVHPSSINFHNTSFQQKHKVVSNYLLYADKQSVVTGYDAQSKTEQVKIYVRDTSEVSPLALVLFGGVVQVIDIPPEVTLEDSNNTVNKRVLVTVDKWIRFYATPREAKIMVALQQALSSLLQTQLLSGASSHEEVHEVDSVSLMSGGTTKSSHSANTAPGSEEWQVHPLIDATCALLDAEVTVTGATSALTVLSTISK